MGTRNLIAVYLDGEYKVAQYSQWDGYPSGNGIECLHFLREFIDKYFPPDRYGIFRNLSWYSREELDKICGLVGVSDDGLISMDQAERLQKWCPELSRDTGADILDMIVKAGGHVKLINNIEFAKNGLFCEWVWVIDFDKDTFEAYEGFNKYPLKPEDRFYSEFDTEDHDYYSPKLVASWPIDRLPSDEEFLSAFKEDD